MKPRSYFVFDVESVGLHGEGFAVGWQLMSIDGTILGRGSVWCDPSAARPESLEAIEWVNAHVPELLERDRVATPADVRRVFWERWRVARDGYEATMAADVPWPVEARFLIDCIREQPARADEGPYPLIDIASVRLARGLDPLAIEPRLEHELPAHNPLCDARQSARLLHEALRTEPLSAANTMVLDDTPRNLR